MPLYENILPPSSWHNTIVTSPLWVYSFLLDISCIKQIVAYFIVNFFIDIISKVVIKYLYDGGKLSNKIMTMSSFLTCISKQANRFVSLWNLLMWSNIVVTILYLAHEELALNEDNVGQTSCLMDIANGLSSLPYYLHPRVMSSYAQRLELYSLVTQINPL